MRIEVSSQGALVRVRIIDAGPGLDDAELSRVFERFYRVPGDSNGGTGLGLSTVKSLVTLLGGSVALLNTPDRRGLIAEVTLPAATDSLSIR